MADSFNKPLDKRPRIRFRSRADSEAAGIMAERIARFTGTPQFIIYLTVFVAAWIAWNSLAPESLRFDSATLGFTALTLMLSLQASYASPLILLAQNRQDDRDRVSAENDRRRAERNLADTEFLTREIASLRMSINDLASRDYVRGELRDQLAELAAEAKEHRNEMAHRDAEMARKDAEIERLQQRIAELEAGK